MSITLRRRPEDKLIELGGGANPVLNPRCRGGQDVCVDIRAATDATGQPTVDFTCDLNEVLPIQSDEFDGVFSQYVLEHLSWRNVRQFISEMHRISKPGARCVCITANTEAQVEYIKTHQEGWDGKDAFDSFSCVLFGDLDYTENAHKNYLSPSIVGKLFMDAGYTNVIVSAYGAANTDMMVQAMKPVIVPGRLGNRTDPAIVPQQTEYTNLPVSYDFQLMDTDDPNINSVEQFSDENKIRLKHHEEELHERLGQNIEIVWERIQLRLFRPKYRQKPSINVIIPELPAVALRHHVDRIEEQDKTSKNETERLMATTEGRSEVFGKAYFNGGAVHGGYMREGMWDFPIHEVTARHVLTRNPESVLEIGASRGYILKRIQNAGIVAAGMEISKHCYMTRVCDPIVQWDMCNTPWVVPDHHTQVRRDVQYDLVFSIAVMEHIPEQHLPAVIGEMQRTCKRGLMGIDFGGKDDGADKSHVSLKPREAWVELFNRYAPGWPVEILDKEELERGDFPPEVLRGDGRIKLNCGSYTVMHHYGWTNLDLHDLAGFAAAYKYNFLRHDIRTGLPYGTGVVDCINVSHVLEHLTYEEGLNFLRECRRVIRPDGAIRIAVPDANKLIAGYVNEVNGETSGYNLKDFAEISDGVQEAPTPLVRLWELLQGKEHMAWLDEPTLSAMLREAAFQPIPATCFTTKGNDRSKQIIREVNDMHPSLSLYMDAIPLMG